MPTTLPRYPIKNRSTIKPNFALTAPAQQHRIITLKTPHACLCCHMCTCGKKQTHTYVRTQMYTPWHIYTPSTIPILTLTGSVHHLFCWGRGGDTGFAEMEEANTRKSSHTGNKSTTGESGTAARRTGGWKEGRKETK